MVSLEVGYAKVEMRNILLCMTSLVVVLSSGLRAFLVQNSTLRRAERTKNRKSSWEYASIVEVMSPSAGQLRCSMLQSSKPTSIETAEQRVDTQVKRNE